MGEFATMAFVALWTLGAACSLLVFWVGGCRSASSLAEFGAFAIFVAYLLDVVDTTIGYAVRRLGTVWPPAARLLTGFGTRADRWHSAFGPTSMPSPLFRRHPLKLRLRLPVAAEVQRMPVVDPGR